MKNSKRWTARGTAFVLALILALSTCASGLSAAALRAYCYGFQATVDSSNQTTGISFVMGAQQGAGNYSLSYEVSGPVSASGSGSAGTVTLSGDFPSGQYTVLVTALDGAGASSTASHTVSYTNNNTTNGVVVNSQVRPIAYVDSITLNNNSATLAVDDTLQLTADVAPSNAANRAVEYTTSDGAVATVSDSGLITAIARGNATITCTAKDGTGVQATCAVRVLQLAQSVSLNHSSCTLALGGSIQLYATVLPAQTDITAVTYVSSDASVASVDSTGRVTANSVGRATITAETTDGSSKTATCVVDVGVPSTGVTVTPTSVSIVPGETKALAAAVAPDNVTNKNVNWTTSDSDVATVSAAGVVTGVAPGLAIITASAADGSGASHACAVTVLQLATSVTLNYTAYTLILGDTVQLTAGVLPASANDPSVEFISSNTRVAVVNTAGLVEAVGYGAATITVKTRDGSNKTATCLISVGVKATGVTVSPKTHTMNVGTTRVLTATVAPDNVSNKNVSWSSSDTTLATVDALGKVTALKAGQVIITATAMDGSGFTDFCTVTIIQMATGISLNYTTYTFAPGGAALQLTATVTPDDTADKTVVFKTSDSRVATVDAAGNVTPVGAGSATITATTRDGSNKSATCEVIVGVPVSKVEVSQSTLSLAAGASKTLSVSVEPVNASNKNVRWVILADAEKEFATVDAQGKVTALKAGTVTVTAIAADGSGKSSSCVVTVTGVAPTPTPTPPGGPGTGGQLARVTTVEGGLNLREKANIGSTRLTVIPQNAYFTVTAYGNTWCAATYNGISGYVMTKFLTIVTSTSPTPTPTGTGSEGGGTATGQRAQVTTVKGGLNLRVKANTGSTRLLVIPQYAYFTVTEYGPIWCAATYNGVSGYVMTKFLTLTGGSVTTPPGTVPTPTPTPPTGGGGTYGKVTTVQGGLNLRKAASEKATRLLIIPQNAYVTVTAYGATWCAVSYNGTAGYVMTKFLTFSASTPVPPPIVTPTVPVSGGGTIYAQVTTARGGLNLRKGMSTLSTLINVIPRNAYVVVRVYGTTWCAVTYNGQAGYVMTQFLSF